jgi:hypothetical protein
MAASAAVGPAHQGTPELNVRQVKWKSRYRVDPEFRAKAIAQTTASRNRKIARCPKYAKLVRLRSRRGQLLTSIEFHRNMADRQERKLVIIARQIAKLTEECRGK